MFMVSFPFPSPFLHDFLDKKGGQCIIFHNSKYRYIFWFNIMCAFFNLNSAPGCSLIQERHATPCRFIFSSYLTINSCNSYHMGYRNALRPRSMLHLVVALPWVTYLVMAANDALILESGLIASTNAQNVWSVWLLY